jgi:hypothetical protein
MKQSAIVFLFMCTSLIGKAQVYNHTYSNGGLLTHRVYVVPPPCGNACRYIMHAYPNPASTTTTLTIDEKLTGETMQIQIVSLDGKIVKNFATTTTQHEINVANLVNGVYFIHVISNKANMQYIFNKID